MMKEPLQLDIKGLKISIFKKDSQDYISLTDIARYKDKERTNYIIQNWMRNRSTIEFVGLWEGINNPIFKGIEFNAFKNLSGLNSFSLTPKHWINKTKAIGIIVKSGRYNGGVFAHKDIAFEFASWISPEFKLYLITEFQRLKEEESNRLEIEWNISRILAKVNYKIHTDSIKDNIIPLLVSKNMVNQIYANEADVLNVALFGITAKEWRSDKQNSKGNLRDYATLEQLVVLSNLESINAELIRSGIPQGDRLLKLNEIAINQIKSLLDNPALNKAKLSFHTAKSPPP